MPGYREDRDRQIQERAVRDLKHLHGGDQSEPRGPFNEDPYPAGDAWVPIPKAGRLIGWGIIGAFVLWLVSEILPAVLR